MTELATLAQDVFSALRTLMIANKPSYVFNNTTYTYTVVASQPNDDTAFPCVVLEDSDVKDTRITLDAGTGDEDIEVTLTFYALEAHGKKAIAVGRDSLRNTFINNISTFITTNKLSPQEDFWTDSGTGTDEYGKQKVNVGIATVRFKF